MKLNLTHEQKQRIEEAIDNSRKTNYSGQTYEEGVRDALDWILGNVEDDDFEY